MHPNLSFEQAPPIGVPFRFFLTAPWFGVAAGLVLAWGGGDALASRWTPVSLALTHLLVVGLMLQSMTGALLQFVPVAAGGNVWRPSLVAGLVHPVLVVAAIALVTAFLGGGVLGFRLAGALFVLALGFYLVVVGLALIRTPARGATVRALRLAVLGLAITVVLGAALADGLSRNVSWPLLHWANVHAAWGLGGWALVLLAGVSYYVVPMFQITPPYPETFARWLPVGLFAVLVAWSFQLTGAAGAWQVFVWFAGLGLAAVFGLMTLRLQWRRRRKVVDATFWFFRTAMISLVGILASAVAMALIPALGQNPRSETWLGVLAIVGVFVSAINGMLYKIVPFISWLHLQRRGGPSLVPPSMRDILAERPMMWQLRAHLVALGMLLLAVPWPPAAPAAGVLFSLSCAWLGTNLLLAARTYQRLRDRIPAAAADPAP